MKRRLTGVALGLVILFALAQLVRPLDGKPKTDPSRTIQAHLQEGSTLGAVLDRSCGNCHTNAASWPWYARIAPVSWLIANGVREGRNAVNFSEWSRYSPAQQRDLLVASCRDASAGRMPDRLYTTLRPEARLTNAEIEAICAAAGQTDDRSAEHRQ